jgi:hypothetical protein
MRAIIASVLLTITLPIAYASAAGTPTSGAAQTLFEFVSASGDYVGQGQTVVLTPAQVTFNPQGASAGTSVVSFFINNFSMAPPGGPYIDWSVDLAAPNGAPLTVGSYPNATRYPFQAANVPGLSIYGDGRGCNQDFGQFQVLEIAFDPSSNALSRFAADFVQTCESLSAPPLVGAIRYNSSIPPPELIAPIINIAALRNATGCFEATSPAGTLVEASASAAGGANLEYTWSTSTGLTASGATFAVQVGLDQAPTLFLTATDSVTGKAATTTAQLCSSDTTPPTIKIISPISGEAYHELPHLNVKVSDVVDKRIKQVSVAIGENAEYALDHFEQLRTVLTARHAIGDMIETQITVTATDASGNTGQASVDVLIEKRLR